MPSMTCSGACSAPSAVSPALLFLTTLFFAHAHPSPSPTPIQLQRRQSFFRCTGWGAGCSNLDYSFQRAALSRPEPRRYEKPVQVVRSRVPPSWWGWSSSRGSRNGYGLHFLFTSGTSWGANGKRSSDSRLAHGHSSADILRSILKELQRRSTIQSKSSSPGKGTQQRRSDHKRTSH